jgi:aminoglycoside phosphotransferase (APT) family kinase protein
MTATTSPRPTTSARKTVSAPTVLADDATILQRLESWAGTHVERMTVLSETHGSNRVLRVEFVDRSLVVKCFADESALTKIGRLCAWNVALGPHTTIRVAEPLLTDTEATFVVMEDFGNSRIDTFLQAKPATDAECLRLMGQVGEALAELQRLDTAGLAVANMKDHLAQLVHPHPLELSDAIPEHRALIEAAVQMLISSAPLPLEAMVVSHRDFHLRQLLRLDGRVGVIDWDFVAVADPAFDVAYLLTYLETHDLDPRGERSIAFLKGYRDARGPQDRSFEKRLVVFRVFNLLRRASRRFRLAGGQLDDEGRRMLDLLETAVLSPSGRTGRS